MRSRSAAAPATNSPMRRRSPRTASSTSPIPGACSTRSTAPPATSAASCGAWTPEQAAPAAQPRRRAVGQSRHHRRRPRRRGSSPPTRTPARWCGTPPSPTPPDVTFTAAPLAIKDKIIIGAANGDQGVRDWIGALDAKTGKRLWRKFTIPAPGEPGSETWKGNNNAWQTGGGAVWVTGTYDPATNQTIWGTGNPGADVRSDLPAGRQSLHQQRDLLRSRHRQDELVLPVHAGRHVGLRRGRHPHPDRRRGRGPAAQADHPFRAQRLPLHDGALQRPDGAGQALHRRSTGPRASTRRPASRSTTIPARTSRPMPASAI